VECEEVTTLVRVSEDSVEGEDGGVGCEDGGGGCEDDGGGCQDRGGRCEELGLKEVLEKCISSMA